MPNFKVNVDFPTQIAQADSAEIVLTVNANLTGYKARCELFDREGNEVKLATTNSGGADTQILISAGATSTITIYIPKDNTDEFNSLSFIEVEIEVPVTEKVYTIYRDDFKMIQEKLTWATP